MPDGLIDVDTFAGPGGWDVAARELFPGVPLVGFECDGNVCSTRAAAHHVTVQANVADVALTAMRGRVRGFIGSPPWQAFSRLRGGYQPDVARVLAHLAAFTGEWVPPAGPWRHHRAPMVLEPLRWVATLLPEWIALEQVPGAGEIWLAMADAFAVLGYRSVVGIVDAANYGVPQHRKRAVLLAHRDRDVAMPTPTHGHGRLHPYVTMAEALGWTEVPAARRNDSTSSGEQDPDWPLHRPATTITGRSIVADPGANNNRFNATTKSRNDGYRVRVDEAGVLQGFDVDYPWQGPRVEQYSQVGDAVPPPLARALLAAVTA